jgi:hypothetical protein
MNNQGFSPVMLFALGVVMSVIFSVIVSSQEKAEKDKTLTTLEVTGTTETKIIVKNIGSNVASNLQSFPPAEFEPATIAPGEEAVGTVGSAMKKYTLITIKSEEGSEVMHRFTGGLRG